MTSLNDATLARWMIPDEVAYRIFEWFSSQHSPPNNKTMITSMEFWLKWFWNYQQKKQFFKHMRTSESLLKPQLLRPLCAFIINTIKLLRLQCWRSCWLSAWYFCSLIQWRSRVASLKELIRENGRQENYKYFFFLSHRTVSLLRLRTRFSSLGLDMVLAGSNCACSLARVETCACLTQLNTILRASGRFVFSPH